jgi:hypothetical protein
MPYRATIQNKATGQYLNTAGYWVKQKVAISVTTRQEARRLAARLNGVILSCTLKRFN